MQTKFTTFYVSFNTSFGRVALEANAKQITRIKLGKYEIASSRYSSGLAMTPFISKQPVGGYIGVSSLLIKAKTEIVEYLAGKRKCFSLSLKLSQLSRMQLKVFKKLSKVLYGETINYKELANTVGTSPRACGQLLASNPFPIIIPCHRVIRANGELGGYSGGLKWKKKLLQLEKRHKNRLYFEFSPQISN